MKRQRKNLESETRREREDSQANSKTIETLSFCTYITSYIISLLLNLQINASLPQLRLCARCVCVCALHVIYVLSSEEMRVRFMLFKDINNMRTHESKECNAMKD